MNHADLSLSDLMLYRALQDSAEEVRRRLSEANIGSTFSIAINVTGRLNSADPLLISFKLSEGVWGNPTEGNALSPVTEEFLRRHGWNKTHSPTMLPPPEVVSPPPSPPEPAHGTIVITMPEYAPEGTK